VRRYFEMFNSGDFSQLADIVSEDYGDKLEGQTSGIQVIRSYFEGLKASFADFIWTIWQIIGESDRVAVRFPDLTLPFKLKRVSKSTLRKRYRTGLNAGCVRPD
jgi:hypothetical protein